PGSLTRQAVAPAATTTIPAMRAIGAIDLVFFRLILSMVGNRERERETGRRFAAFRIRKSEMRRIQETPDCFEILSRLVARGIPYTGRLLLVFDLEMSFHAEQCVGITLE